MTAFRTVLLVIALSFLISACDGAQANSSGEGAQPTPRERVEEQPDGRADREDRSRERADGRSGDRRGGEGREIQAATLELLGDEGTGFSGVCRVGERETELDGTVPETVDLDLAGEPLECTIENNGPGSLKADLSVGNAHYAQQTSAGGADLNFALSGDGYTSSTSSVTAVEASTPDAVSSASSYVEAGPRDEK